MVVEGGDPENFAFEEFFGKELDDDGEGFDDKDAAD